MQLRVSLALCAAVLTIVGGALGSCSSGSPGSLDAARPGTPGAVEGAAQAPGAPAGLPALPPLGTLPAASRSTSLSGPGWIDVVHAQPDYYANCFPSGSNLSVDSTAGMAYALYAVGGFNGDDFPTGVKVNVASATGQFFVGFSDYVKGAWVYAGPFTATVEAAIPGQDAYTSPTAFVSSLRTHYFAIIPAPGAAVEVAGLQLGISGGTLGPAAPPRAFPIGGDTGVRLFWLGSPDDDELDFRGYYIQRAPLLYGNYVTLNSASIRDTLYFDNTAVAGTSYRWRIGAVDVSGNIGPWLSFAGGGAVGDNVPPIVKCSYTPKGKVYGPALFNFDFSATTDPEGDAITEYGLVFKHGPGIITSLTPNITVNLEPGCYIAVAYAKTAINTGYTFYRIKVYPRWEPSPVVVRNPAQNQLGYDGRMSNIRIWRNPGSGYLTLFGYDFTRDEYTVRQQVSASGFATTILPGYAAPMHVSEPFAHGSNVFLVLSNSVAVLILRWTPSANGGAGAGEFRQVWPFDTYNYNLLANVACAGAQDGAGHPWAFWAYDTGSTVDLCAFRADGVGSPVVIVPNVFALSAVDAVYNPSANRIEIAYADSGKMYWLRWNPDTNVVDASNLLDATGANSVDIEYNSVTHEPAVLWNPGGLFTYHTYSERDSSTIWSAPIQVDNSSLNITPYDLAIANGVSYAWFCPMTWQAQLYQLTATTSVVRNIPPDDSSCGFEATLVPGAGDDLISAWEDGSGVLQIKTLHADTTDDNILQIGSTEGQYRQFAADTASDGLHVIFSTYNSMTARHCLSTDGGATWVDQPDLPSSTALSLGNTKSGELYLSYADTGAATHCLRRWDPLGASWVNCGLDTPGSYLHRPVVGGSPLQDDVTWLHWDDVGSAMHYNVGDSGGWLNGTVTLDLTPQWDGATMPSTSLSTPYYSITCGGGSNPSGGYIAFDNFDNETWLFSPPGNAPYDTLTGNAVAGNAFAIAAGLEYDPSYDPIILGWAADGPSHAPVRYVEHSMHDGQQELPISAPADDFWRRDLRRTVSAATAYGPTAVAVLAHLDGRDPYMEWAAFGEFEALPVPNLSGGVHPTLCVGADGRWHLIFRDPESDTVYCYNTQ